MQGDLLISVQLKTNAMKTKTKIRRSSTPRNPAINTYLPESVSFSTLSEIYPLERIVVALNAAVQQCELRPSFPKHLLHTLIVFYHDLVEFEYGPKTLNLLRIEFERTWAVTKPIKRYEFLFTLDSAIWELTAYTSKLEPSDEINLEVLRGLRNHLIKTHLGEQSWELCEALVA